MEEEKKRYHRVLSRIMTDYVKYVSDQEHTDEYWEKNYEHFNKTVNEAPEEDKKLVQGLLEVIRKDLNGELK